MIPLRRRVRRTAALVTAALAVVVATSAIAVAPAAAAPVDVVVDESPVRLTASADGTHATRVEILNVSDAPVLFTADTVNDDPGCRITPSPASVDPATRATVTFTFGSGCATAGGVDFVIDFDGDTRPSSVELGAEPAPASAGPDWTILRFGAIAGVLLALGGLVLVAMNVTRLPGPGVSLRTELPNLGTSWSFKDSWIANVTVGGTLLAGLLGASNVLEPVLGTEPTDALALMVVAGAIATVLVGAGPLALKAVGRSVDVPTYGGMLLAAFVVLAGSFLQIAAVSRQAYELTDSDLLRIIVVAAAVGIAVLVLAYAVRAFAGFVAKGITLPRASVPPEVQAALLIVEALRPDTAAAAEAEVRELAEARDLAEAGYVSHRQSPLL